MDYAISTDRHRFLKKHVALVHCENKFNMLERKISNILLYFAYEELTKSETHKISFSELAKLAGYNSNDYFPLKAALLKLIKTPIEYNLLDSIDAGQWTISSLLASARSKNSILEYSYSPHLKELLYNPQKYAKINIDEIIKLKSQYSISLYENCIRFIGVKQTPWISLDVFRKLMGINDGSYAYFRDIKRRVIDYAVNEIKDKTQFLIKPHYMKLGRNVDKIKFFVGSNNKYVASEINIEDFFMAKFGFSEARINYLINKYGESRIKEKFSVLNNIKSNPSSGQIVDLAAYIDAVIGAACVKNNVPSKSNAQKLSEEDLVKISEEITNKKNKLRNLLRDNPNLISAPTQIDVFAYYLKHKGLDLIFKTEGFQNQQILKEFFDYFDEGLETLFSHICVT